MRMTRPMLHVALLSAAGITASVHADAWSPPPMYYSGVTGTGATLKAQLTTAMSSGHIQRSYGDFRYSSALHDADPNQPGNILLSYNRASVSSGWDSGATWNREHVWPQSLQPGSASNSSRGNLGDPHALRPCNPSINSSRSNKPFGFESTTGSYGSQGAYYFPGDSDKGDIARSLFYSDTRWTSLGIALVDSFPGSNQMGGLSSLVAWNYLDAPDDFERARNHRIFSSSENPQYHTNNRNAYIDNPWLVWSVYVDQSNDSQVWVGTSAAADGSSSISFPFGEVLVGDAPSGSASVTINKIGQDGTYFDVVPGAGAGASITGPYNAFPINAGGADSASIDVHFDSLDTSTPGPTTAEVVIDNRDVTLSGGMGRGGNDADDVIILSVDVLDHANASFDPSMDEDLLVIDLGTIEQGSGDAMVVFDLYNIGSDPAYLAALDVELDSALGDAGVLTTSLGTVDALVGSQSFIAFLSDDVVGDFGAVYTFRTYDDRSFAAAAEGAPITLLLGGEVIPAVCPGDYSGDQFVDFDDLNVVLQDFGGAYDFDDLNEVLSNWLIDCAP